MRVKHILPILTLVLLAACSDKEAKVEQEVTKAAQDNFIQVSDQKVEKVENEELADLTDLVDKMCEPNSNIKKFVESLDWDRECGMDDADCIKNTIQFQSGLIDVPLKKVSVEIGGEDLDIGGEDLDIDGEDLDIDGADLDIGGTYFFNFPLHAQYRNVPIKSLFVQYYSNPEFDGRSYNIVFAGDLKQVKRQLGNWKPKETKVYEVYTEPYFTSEFFKSRDEAEIFAADLDDAFVYIRQVPVKQKLGYNEELKKVTLSCNPEEFGVE